MIGPDELQEGIISKLKADATLVAYLTGLGVPDEIREVSWQAKDFKYPCVRVDIGLCSPYGGDKCELNQSEILFEVQAFSVEASSRQCGHLIGLTIKALFGKSIQATNWHSQWIRLMPFLGPRQIGENVWQSGAPFRMLTHE